MRRSLLTKVGSILLLFVMNPIDVVQPAPPLPQQVPPRTNRRSLDDMFAAVATRVPAFGGMFIGKDSVLNVFLLDTSSQVVAAARTAIIAVFGRARVPPRGIQAVKGQYGFLQLKGMHDRSSIVLAIPGVVFTDVDERKNRLRIGLERMEVQPEVERRFAALRIVREAVNFEQDKPIEFEQVLQDKVRPLIGGLMIAPNCTLGFLAIRAGVRGFVTASHCTNVQGGVEGTVFYQPSNSGGNQVGTETVDPAYSTGGTRCPAGRRCRASDAAFVKISTGVTGLRGEIAKPWYPADPFPGPFEVGGEGWYPLEGELLFKVGQKTGLSWGEVDATCYDVNVNLTNVTLYCQDRVDAASGKGDSGSPVIGFTGPNYSGAILYGILWGGRSDGSAFSFSSLSNIEMASELGPMTVVKGNDPPSVTITAPANGAKVGYGGLNNTTFTAAVNDFEGGISCCTVTWNSSKDGYMATGNTIEFNLNDPGPRTITATAKDKDGATASASISVTAINSPPQVSIIQPTAGQTLYKGFPYILLGYPTAPVHLPEVDE